MCFGVRRAIAIAQAVSCPEEVTIRGELVHNEQVSEELGERGFHLQPESECGKLPDTRRVLITAHGISDRERRRLGKAGKELIDTTCPLVRRIHETAKSLHSKGYFVIVIGQPDHVEVQGIVDDLECFTVVAGPGEVQKYDARRLAVICQSTTSPSVAQETLAEIYAQNPGTEIHYVATFCEPTRRRQAAVRALLHEVEAVVVVGGRRSRNTLELVRLARSRGVACVHVQAARDVRPEWFEPFETVGLTAGTSTPDEVIEEVYQSLLAVAARRERVAV